MAFSSLPSALIQVGRALKKEILQILKDNQDDIESRLVNLEGGQQKLVIFDFPVLNASSASTLTGLTYWRVPFEFTLLDAKLAIFEKGSLTGVLEVDFKKNSSLDSSGMVSVFTTRPSVTMASANDYDESTNAVLDPLQTDMIEGDYIRMDITSLPTPIIGKFMIYLIGEIN